MTDEELIKDIVRDKKIMYASREAGIESFAKTYSFNIESVLFNQLTLEQQKLWRKEIENAAISGGEMGLELAYDKRYDKELSKNLEEEIEKIDDQYPVEIQYIREIARHFAEWQKKKDQETIELAEDHAMLAGMNKMEEEMMKNAVETTIVNDWQYGKDPDYAIIPAIHQRINGFNVGDKVKIIICKTEQQ